MVLIEVKDNVYEVIRINIKYYRKLKGMTQEEFAEAMDMSYDYIRQVESAKSGKHFSIPSLKLAADVLGIKIEDLFKEREVEEV